MDQTSLFVRARFEGGPHDGRELELASPTPETTPTWFHLPIPLNEPLEVTSSTSSLAPDPCGCPSHGRGAYYKLSRLTGGRKNVLNLVYRYVEDPGAEPAV